MPDKELSLIGHLTELRKRIIYCLIPFLLATVFSALFTRSILGFLRLPAKGAIEKLAFFSPQEIAVTYIKIAIFSGLLLTLPVILSDMEIYLACAGRKAEEAYNKFYLLYMVFVFHRGRFLFFLPVAYLP